MRLLNVLCTHEKVTLPRLEYLPSLIKSLSVDTHPEYIYFLDKFTWYNGFCQMISFSVKDTKRGNSIFTVKIRGQVYHRLGRLLFEPEKNSKLLQI